MSRPLFSWLHLSDIHFGEPGAATQTHKQLVLEDLVKALPWAIQHEKMPRPDVILVTGDVAFSGAAREPDEYERARTWLASVAGAVGRTAGDVYLVPGNHDVQRARAGSPAVLRALNAVREGTATLDDTLAEPEARQALLACAVVPGLRAPARRGHRASRPAVDVPEDWLRALCERILDAAGPVGLPLGSLTPRGSRRVLEQQ